MCVVCTRCILVVYPLQIEHLKSVCDMAGSRPLNWQTFCKDNKGWSHDFHVTVSGDARLSCDYSYPTHTVNTYVHTVHTVCTLAPHMHSIVYFSSTAYSNAM